MKKILLTYSLILLFLCSYSQNSDSVILNSSYTNQSFYNLNDGEIANIDNTNWDLAFSSSGYGSAIRINAQAGVELFVYPNGDINDWNSVDITNINNWSSIINSDTTWTIGAFNATSDPTNSLDLGWGVYSTITHHITGDSIHIIKLSNGDYKKLQMIKLSSGVYDFKYANIDGSNEVTTNVSKSNYISKNFGYYSLTNEAELDREPDSDSWHILFTKYVSEIYPGTNYAVTGVLTNKDIEVAKAEGVDISNVNYNSYSFSSQINTIGYNWKSYNMSSFSYDIVDSLCFFIKDDFGSIWKLQLTGFEGSSSGKINFNIENILSASDNVLDKNVFAIYPNPTKSKEIKIIYDLNYSTSSLNKFDFYDLNGKLVKSLKLANNGFFERDVNLYDLKSGIYFVSLITDEKSFQQKLIIQ
tara:strand:+ start:1603 stop:2847 length:1245 start_codon:yes stop_codon:yes gene_type:complete